MGGSAEDTWAVPMGSWDRVADIGIDGAVAGAGIPAGIDIGTPEGVVMGIGVICWNGTI